jgi:ADP-L-glycero-D-manno-heptose 6-epimerase
MKIIVTGHEGFIGSHVYRALVEAGHTVIGHEWGDPKPPMSGVDWVIHLGAISSTVERDVPKILAQNLDDSIEWFNRCKFYGINMQFASTASIYGTGTDFREDAAVDPRTPYAWSKYLFERHVAAQRPQIQVQMFRYFNVFGTGEDHKGSQASPYHQFMTQARQHGEITVFEGSARAARDFVPVGDVVSTHLKFLSTAASGVFNVGTGTATTFLEIAEMISVTHNAKIHVVPMPESIARGYQWYTCADMSKTHAALTQTNK